MQITTLPVAWLTATSIIVLLGLVMVLSYSFVHFNLLNSIRIAKWHAEKLRKAKDKPEESDRLKSAFLVIIAEDDKTSALYLQTILKKESNIILLTKNGHETVDACRNNPDADLVLMDIQMAEMNGYDATREIRKFNKNVIIIAQTAFALL